MTTREHILKTADDLIRDKGYNAFSFVDIANTVGIKKASIYHHFPHKSDLGVAVVRYHIENLNKLMAEYKSQSPIEKLEAFFQIHSHILFDKKVCLVGSLTPDSNTLDTSIIEELKKFAELMLNWVTDFLEEGRNSGVFHFKILPRTKALLIISNMVAIVPITRITEENDFKLIKEAIKEELLIK
ncbi:TetR family transcriptional regulator [Elizabethkingia meningoseptica]|uniref:TetR family transcriptional regulator n=2 Tax=Elizabethkingia meningoseptica TaxID=238 RepID=A0A1T3IUH0_ELIME|nr:MULTISPECIES: TetR/AcrR family transcriptional regulator [Elizabethkingia]AQX11004.1 TetR family transcriptional regulator [Elizabethkingia meningoseptica]MBG0512324.1 TetR/AcrR family transcriptional regulator [Elizabethkingia meningoseptica]MCL1676852.1 TetR/AcrR family transcriptional regulator [Elizabethkingia meningoseptica]MCL1684997.1 TetR/AcrR family transcriptional regulator [Elizabethkingia meningoseptica]MDE5435630.1 TetR/AcrR family transcriptional regulator [Elizabethkingia men